MYLYDFFYYPINHKLYMELWEEKPDGIEFIRSVPIDNIGHGFRLLENYKRNGADIKRG